MIIGEFPWIIYPVVMTSIAQWKNTIFNGKINFEWPFSIVAIVMLNYQSYPPVPSNVAIGNPLDMGVSIGTSPINNPVLKGGSGKSTIYG